MLTENTIKIIKKAAKDRTSQIKWNPELNKGVKEEKMDKPDLHEMMAKEIAKKEVLKEGAPKDMAKLFPELKDSPETHRQRMVHSVTRYDQKEAEKARKDPKHYHDVHALGHYHGAVDRAHEDMSKGMSVGAAINHNFNGKLATHLHKHCGSGGCVKESAFDENQVRFGVSRSLVEASRGVLKTKKLSKADNKKIKKIDDGTVA